MCFYTLNNETQLPHPLRFLLPFCPQPGHIFSCFSIDFYARLYDNGCNSFRKVAHRREIHISLKEALP